MSTVFYRRPSTLCPSKMPTRGHVVIEASAGTGKTYTLEHLVLDLIIGGHAKVEEILVVTFTEAATRELRERVRKLIREVCDATGPTERPADGHDYWCVDDKARALLQGALFSFDAAAIATIHGFCQRILSEQAFLGGRLFEQEHADASEMFGLAFREELREALAEESRVRDMLDHWVLDGGTVQALQGLLFKAHREGVPDRCDVTPIWDPEGLFEAAEGVPPASELKAAGAAVVGGRSRKSLDQHIDSLFEVIGGRDDERPVEFCVAFASWAAEKKGLGGSRARIDNLRRLAFLEGASSILADLAGALDRIEERCAGPASILIHEMLPRVQVRLAERKRALGLLDYDDMLLGVRDAIAAGDEASRRLVDTLRRRWSVALVDEFQDTDPVQWEIFERLFVDGTSRHRLFVIGDPKQAIYGFRGADVHTYDAAKRHLIDQTGAARVVLDENYRSTEAVIDTVNEILTTERDGKGFFSGINVYDVPVLCGNPSRFAEEGTEPAAPIHLMHCHANGKLSPELARRGVAAFIADEIRRLVKGPRPLSVGEGGSAGEPIRFRDIYVLTRTGPEGLKVGRALRARGVPHAFYKQDGLFKTDEAGEVHRLLCAIDRPNDPSARMKAWLTPFFGASLADMGAWSEVDDGHPMVARLLQWKELAEEQAWSRMFDAIVSGSGISRRLILSGDERALTNYLHLFEVLLGEAHSRPVTLTDLAAGLAARIDGRRMPEGREGDVQRLETDKDAVQILTMHKAKGLEAKVVFLMGGFGSLPGDNVNVYHRDGKRALHIGKASGPVRQAMDQEERQESERLLYVALTRAKARLYLPYFGDALGEVCDDPLALDSASSKPVEPSAGAEPGAVEEGLGDADDERRYGYSVVKGACYRPLYEQLEALRSADPAAFRSKFVARDVRCSLGRAQTGEARIDLSGWPDERLLEPPPTCAEEARRLEAGHRGVLLTSYTRMQRGAGWAASPGEGEERTSARDEEVASEAGGDRFTDAAAPKAADLPDEDAFESDPSEVGFGRLPGGREVGIFLHSILEETPPRELLEESEPMSLEAWAALPHVRARAAAAARRHGIAEDHLDESLSLVHAALTARVCVESREGRDRLELPRGIAASGSRHIAEMDFAYPIPEAAHPLLGAGGSGKAAAAAGELPYAAHRGYVQGLIDLVFEHDGKTYLLDWKSDRLAGFDGQSINEHVAGNYRMQARIYLLAVARMLCFDSEDDYEARFGGVLYVFLRGVDAARGADRGIWFSRPSWSEVRGWEQDLLSREQWGGPVIKDGTS